VEHGNRDHGDMARKKSETGSARRGRPPAYDAETALKRATEAFWRTGYSGTSLDKVAAATGMSPPSLYAVFGNKHALYLEALARYWEMSLAATREALAGEHPLDEALVLAYEAALSIYFSGKGHVRGCFVVGTAVTEVAEDAAIRKSVATGLRAIDADFEARFRRAQDKGELKPDADPATLAILASATMHTIAIRARAGTSRTDLSAIARKAVKVICG
jgi:AcrR family transcriptional regulator